MAAQIHVGCCGWSYIRESDFRQLDGIKRASKLDSYARLFPSVEINSSYYAIPRAETAEKWRQEVDRLDRSFEFTIKMYKGITHTARFGGAASSFYEDMKPLIPRLGARVLLFQSPATFGPTEKNIRNMEEFFGAIDRRGITCVWEPRGAWYDEPGLIDSMCAKLGLVQCVDPFRNEQTAFGEEKMAYYRLHGFGSPTMYNYDFSPRELRRLYEQVQSFASVLNDVYVMFNNQTCYRNGLEFLEMLRGQDGLATRPVSLRRSG